MLAPGFTPFPSYLGVTQVSQGSALVHTNYCIVYLEFETTLGSFGEGLVTLTPGWSKSQKLRFRPNATGGCFARLDIYFKGYCQGGHTLPAPPRCVLLSREKWSRSDGNPI